MEEGPRSDPMNWQEQTPPQAQHLSNPASILYRGTGQLNNNLRSIVSQSTRATSTRRPLPFDYTSFINRSTQGPSTSSFPSRLTSRSSRTIYGRLATAHLQSNINRSTQGPPISSLPSRPTSRFSRTAYGGLATTQLHTNTNIFETLPESLASRNIDGRIRANFTSLFNQQASSRVSNIPIHPSFQTTTSLRRLVIERDPDKIHQAYINLFGEDSDKRAHQALPSPRTPPRTTKPNLFNTTPTLGRRTFSEFAQGEVVATQRSTSDLQNPSALIPGAFPSDDIIMTNDSNINRSINEPAHVQQTTAHLVQRLGLRFALTFEQVYNVVLQTTHTLRTVAQATGRYAFARRHHLANGYRATAQATRRLAPQTQQAAVHTYRAAVDGATTFKRRLVEFTTVRRRRRPAVPIQAPAVVAEIENGDEQADGHEVVAAPLHDANVEGPRGAGVAPEVHDPQHAAAGPNEVRVERPQPHRFVLAEGPEAPTMLHAKDKVQAASLRYALKVIGQSRARKAAKDQARRDRVDEKKKDRRVVKNVVRNARKSSAADPSDVEDGQDVQGEVNLTHDQTRPTTRRQSRLRRQRRDRTPQSETSSSQDRSSPIPIAATAATLANSHPEQEPAPAAHPISGDATTLVGPSSSEQATVEAVPNVPEVPAEHGSPVHQLPVAPSDNVVEPLPVSPAAQMPMLPAEQSSPLSSLHSSPTGAMTVRAQETRVNERLGNQSSSGNVPIIEQGARTVHFFESPNSGQPVDSVRFFEEPSMTDVTDDGTLLITGSQHESVEADGREEEHDVEEGIEEDDTDEDTSADEVSGADSFDEVIEVDDDSGEGSVGDESAEEGIVTELNVEDESTEEDIVRERNIEEESLEEETSEDESVEEGSLYEQGPNDQSVSEQSLDEQDNEGEILEEIDQEVVDLFEEGPIDYNMNQGHEHEEGFTGQVIVQERLVQNPVENAVEGRNEAVGEESLNEQAEEVTEEGVDAETPANNRHVSGSGDQVLELSDSAIEVAPKTPEKKTAILPPVTPQTTLPNINILNISGRRVSVRVQEEADRRAAKQHAIEIAAQLSREAAEAEERERKRQEEEAAAEKIRSEEEAAEKARLKAEADKQELLRQLGRRVPTQPVFTPMSEEWKAKVQKAMETNSRSHEVATTSRGTALTRGDLGRVLPQQGSRDSAWLNDEVVNGYLQAVVDYGLAKVRHRRGDIPKYHAFNTFFYSKLIDPNQGPSSVTRWAARPKVGGKNIEKVDRIFIPCNNNNMHWTLLVIHGSRRVVEYFDSFHGHAAAHLQTAREWLQYELGNAYNDRDWKYIVGNSPTQHNGHDCGVFTVTTAKMILLGWEPASAYGASDLAEQRVRMVAEFMNGGFTGDFTPVDSQE